MERNLSPAYLQACRNALLGEGASLRDASHELRRHARELAALAAEARGQAAILLRSPGAGRE
jgi:hypothetical protein